MVNNRLPDPQSALRRDDPDVLWLVGNRCYDACRGDGWREAADPAFTSQKVFASSLDRYGVLARAMKPTQTEPAEAFDAVLAEVECEGAAEGSGSEVPKPYASVLASVALPFAETDAGVCGGPTRWDDALAWLEKDELQGGLDTEDAGSEATIANELGITPDMDRAQLNQARRLFMQRNHPDHFEESLRDRATRRASIANMLIDRAQARIDAIDPRK